MEISKYCRVNKVRLIVTDNKGVFSRIFCDFGDDFVCFDKNGEEATESMIESIEISENGEVKCLEGIRHDLQDGDTIVMTKVVGMDLLPEKSQQVTDEKLTEANEKPTELADEKPTEAEVVKDEVNNEKPTEVTEEKPTEAEVVKDEVIAEKKPVETKPEPLTSINGAAFKVTVVNSNKFRIGDTRLYSGYTRGGLAKLIKVPELVKFKPYHEVYNTGDPIWSPDLLYHDGMKIFWNNIIHLGFLALGAYEEKNGSMPGSYCLEDFKELVKIAQELSKKDT
jgi:hypothetical protein